MPQTFSVVTPAMWPWSNYNPALVVPGFPGVEAIADRSFDALGGKDADGAGAFLVVLLDGTDAPRHGFVLPEGLGAVASVLLIGALQAAVVVKLNTYPAAPVPSGR